MMIVVGLAYSNTDTKYSYYVNKGFEIIQNTNKDIDEWDARQISYYLYRECLKHDIDFHFALGIMRTESRFNPNAKSYCGAIGLMQIMPKTANKIAKLYEIEFDNLFDLRTNIQIGMAYLSRLKKDLGSYELTAAGYNGGKGGALKYREYKLGNLTKDNIPNETLNYVKKVMNYHRQYKKYMMEVL